MCWVHIIGGGVSGLSLALALAEQGALPGDVVISDPRMFDQRSQTFCFWFTEDERDLLQPERSWSSWSFSTHARHPQPHQAHTHQGSRYLYGVVSGEAFRQRALERLQAHPQVRLSESLVTSPPSARHVFDSRPPRRDQFWVHQSFVGFELNTTHTYPLERVSLMEEMSEGFGGMLFKYVLPFSADRVLIEYTVFTQAHIDLDDLHRYALSALEREGLGRYEVIRVERAHIPMGLKSQGQHLGVPIGTRAGMARDATGYGFVEMQRWAKLASESLMIKDRALRYHAPRLRSWMDAQLLSLIEHKPAILPELFMTLASMLPADRFASFMMSCEPSDAAAMILSAPKPPFLCAMIGRPQWIS